MRRYLQISLFLIALFFMTNVYAKCTYNDQAKLMTEAANIKVAYEVKEKEDKSGDWECADGEAECGTLYLTYMQISILNLSDNFYIIARNNINNEEKVFNSSDANKDGIIYYNWYVIDQVTHFTFDIYSSEKTNCTNNKQRSLHLTTPRENEYADYVACDNKRESEYCKRFVTYDEITDDEFHAFIDNYDKKQKKEVEEKNSNKFFKFIKENKKVVISGVIVLVVITGTVVYVIIYRKRKIYEKYK